MHVMLLVGRQAGTVVDLPYHAATAGYAAGTCRAVTDEEMQTAGISLGRAVEVTPEGAPLGYRVEPNEEVGGYDAYAPDGTALNGPPLRNAAAARSVAQEHFAHAKHLEEAARVLHVPLVPSPAVAMKPAGRVTPAATRVK